MSYDIAGIISGVKTKTELNNLLRELEMLEKSLYQTGENDFDEVLHNGVSQKLSEAIQNLLHGQENSQDQNIRKALLDEIIHSVNNLKSVKMEISVEPSQGMIKKIHKWITENTGAGRIMEIIVDENIIAGARITYEGKYAECTLNKVWDEVWQEIRKKKAI